MFCPICKTEYEPWVKECTDCLVPLVDTLPEENDFVRLELVTVFATGNPALVAMAKSFLEEAGIVYLAKGEGLQHLFGAGSIGGFNPAVGPVEIQVDVEDEREARELLDDLENDTSFERDDNEEE